MADGAAVLHGRLTALRRLVRLAMVSAGAGRFACALAALVAADFALDRALQLSTWLRSGVLVGAGGLLLWLLVRRVGRPLLRPLPLEALAMELEARAGLPRDLLSSALQFVRDGGGLRGKDGLRRQTVRRAAAAAGRLAPGGLVRWRPARRWSAGGAAAVAALVMLAAAFPESASLWLRRNVLLRTVPWPRATRLVLVSAPAAVARGSPAGIVVRADGRRPRTARLTLREARNGRESRFPMERTEAGVFAAQTGPLTEDVEFSVRAGDGLLAGERIAVVERPRVEAARLVVRPPAYTGIGRTELAWTAPVFQVPAGSDVEVLVEASRPLGSALCRVGEEVFRLDDLQGRRSASFTFPVSRDLGCEVALTDVQGIEMARPLAAKLRVLADAVPQVRLAAPGVGDMVLAEARVPLEAVATDDYGIGSLWLDLVYRGRDGATWRDEVPLWRGPEARELEGRHELSLGTRRVAPGGRLLVSAAARDNCALDGPNIGRSAPLSFRVVTKHGLLASLLLRQQDLRRDLEEQVERQDGLIGRLPDSEGLPSAQRALAPVLELTASGYGDVLAQMLNNGVLAETAHAARVDGIVRPLESLAAPEGAVAAAAGALAAGEAEPARRAMRSARDEMAKVRARMMLLEDYAAVVASLEEISEGQRELLGRTRQRERSLLEILGGGR
jgi:hypothetical protein